MGGPLSQLPILTDTRSGRVSSWDESGGNDDRLHIRPGERALLAELAGPGVIRHIWMTISCAEPGRPSGIPRSAGGPPPLAAEAIPPRTGALKPQRQW